MDFLLFLFVVHILFANQRTNKSLYIIRTIVDSFRKTERIQKLWLIYIYTQISLVFMLLLFLHLPHKESANLHLKYQLVHETQGWIGFVLVHLCAGHPLEDIETNCVETRKCKLTKQHVLFLHSLLVPPSWGSKK